MGLAALPTVRNNIVTPRHLFSMDQLIDCEGVARDLKLMVTLSTTCHFYYLGMILTKLLVYYCLYSL